MSYIDSVNYDLFSSSGFVSIYSDDEIGQASAFNRREETCIGGNVEKFE